MKHFASPLLLFHGGLGPSSIKPEKKRRILRSLSKIAKHLQQRLKKANNSALEEVLEGVRLLEADPLFNAGLGSKLQADGKARLSAALMDGSKHQMAGVANLEGFVHPSVIAKELLAEEDRILLGHEAAQYALAKGLAYQSPITEQRRKEWEEKQQAKTGTVGCIALDKENQTAACTSTGGKGMELAGRGSDSFMPAGNFAAEEGACSATGVGEDIIDAALSSSIVTRLEDGMSLQEAVHRSFFKFSQRNFGVIALDRHGKAIVHATQGTLAFGLVSPTKYFVGLHPTDWTRPV